jgi:hypothetical protein
MWFQREKSAAPRPTTHLPQIFYVYIYSKDSSPGSAYPNSVKYLFHRREDHIILANRIHNQSIHHLSPSPTDPHRWSLAARS